MDCGAKHLIKTDLVEKAFFLDVMRASPADLMIEAPRENQQKAALEARLAKADAELGKLLALSEKHSLAQLDARISALQSERSAAEAELGRMTVAGVQTGLVPAALTALQKCWDWDTIAGKQAFKGGKPVTLPNILEEEGKALAQLIDPAIRAKVIPILAELVDRLEFDFDLGICPRSNSNGKGFRLAPGRT